MPSTHPLQQGLRRESRRSFLSCIFLLATPPLQQGLEQINTCSKRDYDQLSTSPLQQGLKHREGAIIEIRR